MKYTFENLRKISQNEYERHTVDHIENITTDNDMEGKTTVEKQEHLCGTLGLYGTQSQINLGVMVLEELRELERQNKRYREALEFINEELELVLHSNKGLAEKMFYIENSKRKITEVLEGESE